MNYWLLKTEPETFSWTNLMTDGKATWDGVRNFQARNNLRKMKCGDIALFYHSGKNPEIVGIAVVSKEFFPDPTAIEGDWSAIEVQPVRSLEKPVALQQIKQTMDLQDMVLLRNSRLSVQPVSQEEYDRILTFENGA